MRRILLILTELLGEIAFAQNKLGIGYALVYKDADFSFAETFRRDLNEDYSADLHYSSIFNLAYSYGWNKKNGIVLSGKFDQRGRANGEPSLK